MKTQLSALLVGIVLTQAVLADDSDPPSLVGRVSYVQGNAGLQAGETTAEQVELNRPVTIGDRVRTETQALVELSLGTSAIRLDENTDVTVANLDDDITQLQLDAGAVSLHVFELDPKENIEIDTPTATVRLLEPGDYRIDARSDGTTRVAVRHGSAELDGGGGPVRIRDQQQLVFAGTDEPADIVAMTTPDDFDQWAMSRDRHFEESQSAKYVSREVVGYEDLDSNGSWDSDPDYGEVWYPTRVASDWAPYRDGRWVWVQPWGWSWVDDAPWGFAPFHYGRWAYLRSRWGWVPGPRSIRPVYAPALVSWDGRPGVSFTITTRPARWFPLGPREVYVPAHRVSPRYLRNVNVSNTIIVNNTHITNAYQNRARDMHYMNRSAPNAVTTREILPRIARPAPPARPLPPRSSAARGIAQREGVPVTSRPAQPFRGRPSEVERARGGERDNLGAGRLQPGLTPNAPVGGAPERRLPGRQSLPDRDNAPVRDPRSVRDPVAQRAQQQERENQQRQVLQQRQQLQQREQQEQREVGQQRQQLEQAQRQQQAQVQQREQLQQREQSARQQEQVQRQQEQIQRQQQQVQEQAQRQQQLHSEQFQRQQEARQQQDQVRNQQAQRQNQARQEQMQRAQQVQQQQNQVRAQDAQRQAREAASAPRAVERREDPRRGGRDERQQVR